MPRRSWCRCCWRLLAGIITTPLFLYLRRYLPGWLSLLVMICGLVMVGFGVAQVVEGTISAFGQRSDAYTERIAEYHGQFIDQLVAWGFGRIPQELALAPSSVLSVVTGSLTVAANLLSQGFSLISCYFHLV